MSAAAALHLSSRLSSDMLAVWLACQDVWKDCWSGVELDVTTIGSVRHWQGEPDNLEQCVYITTLTQRVSNWVATG